jgi:glycosyltransferase involved in cell wall biosynthesis
MVEDGRTGLHFTTGEPEDLADAVARLWAEPAETRRMGREARAEFEAKYTAERNYPILMDIYSRALSRRTSGGR